MAVDVVGAVEEVVEEEGICIDLDGAIMEDGIEDPYCGEIGMLGPHFGLFLAIVSAVVRWMGVLFQEQVRMTVFGLQIVIVAGMFIIEHKKRHYIYFELKKRH